MTIPATEIYPMLSTAERKIKRRHASTCVYVGHVMTLVIMLAVGSLIVYTNYFASPASTTPPSPASTTPASTASPASVNVTSQSLEDVELSKFYSSQLAEMYNKVKTDMNFANKMLNSKLDEMANLIVVNKLHYNEISKLMEKRLEDKVAPALDVLQLQFARLLNTSETISKLFLFNFELKSNATTYDNATMYDDDHV